MTMREINAALITETVARLCIEANRFLPEDVACALHKAEQEEPFAPARICWRCWVKTSRSPGKR